MLEGTYNNCQRRVAWDLGILFINFGKRRGYFPTCGGAWFEGCYLPHSIDVVTVMEARDFNGIPIACPEDEGRFICARVGNHTMASFQCENYQSQNFRGISLMNHIAYQVFAYQFIPAKKDSFWDR
mmetsp:Transcript_11536/g.33985  ORF Transcript_11536/g.33985 Transcript_11536/m.33985 type:complete len:126 (+) Transcript_11536:5972-6349(+)